VTGEIVYDTLHIKENTQVCQKKLTYFKNLFYYYFHIYYSCEIKFEEKVELYLYLLLI